MNVRRRVLLCLWILSQRAFACDGLEARRPWVREAPPVATVLAGFGELRNGSQRPVLITGISSPQFGQVMLHETVLEKGEARMRVRETLALAPGARSRLEPGGLHLMLMNATTSTSAESVIVQFACGDAHTTITFPVRQTAP